MMTRFLLSILLCTVGLRAIMAATPTPVRPDRELCDELTAEVNISAERGLLTREEARDISERCYKLYVYGGN